MEIDFAFICDYAQVTGGKIHALGVGFDTIFARKVPAKHPMFHLVVQLRANVTETGPKEIEVHLIDADGTNVIQPLKSKFEIAAPKSGVETVTRLAMGFNNVSFPQYGLYSLHLDVQGREMVRIPLRVAPPPQQSAPPPEPEQQ